MKNKSYWIRRTAAFEAALQNEAADLSASIIYSYEKAIKNINADIHKTFKAYTATGIPEDEAKKLLNAAENDKLYQELLQLYQETDDPKIKAEILRRINTQAYGARINRLEGVKTRIYIQLRKVANIAEKKQKTLYTNTFQSSYYTNIYNIAEGLNCGIDFSLLPQRAIDKVLREPWHGKNYSERVWIHNDRFIEAVQNTITTGITAGHSVNRMAESLEEYVKDTAPDGIRTSTTALVRSETSHFMNQGQLAAYEEIGIKQYQFVAALSERTCDRCIDKDGQIFNISEAVEGENYPPLHTSCRCITIMADAISATRIASDPVTGKNYKIDGSMTFKEWKNSLSDEQKAALKYVDKSVGNGIISMRGNKIMNINNIDSPIEQRNTGKGNPSAIIHIDRPLNNRQQKLLDSLPEYDSSVIIHKKDVNMRDLAALTAYTGDEFAVFTKENKRLIIRGNKNSVNVDIKRAKELNNQGYRWSGHTHPGVSPDFATPSQGDKDILNCFNQNTSVIYNSTGTYRTFEKE